MGKLSPANLKKTLYYLQRNGLRETMYAARERLFTMDSYTYEAPSREILDWQRQQAAEWGSSADTFSLVVPVYRTNPLFLQELIRSVNAQTYPYWELILADATEDDSVERQVTQIITQLRETDIEMSERIRYVRLPENRGISANTNAALEYVSGTYIGLLDHDDLLTPDALFEMADEIRRCKEEREVALQLLYSDEDKCDGDGAVFYEPNHKEKFNYDLLLSNNYICHFLVMKRELLQKLRLRPEFDGAQDYDLLLRAVWELGIGSDPARERRVAHIPKVLYHWRCHQASTAENPRSKTYAYDAGKRALEAYLTESGLRGRVRQLKHVGFYEVRYPHNIFEIRKDLGAVGGAVIQKNRIVGGRMNVSGKVYYENLPVHYSGYLHRAVLTQDARAVDIRNIRIRPELWDTFEQVTGVPYSCKPGTDIFDVSALAENTDYKKLSLELCRAIRKQGYRILWRRDNE